MSSLTLKDRIKYVMWLAKLRSSLPAKIINSVDIFDNNDELVNIKRDKNLYFSEELQKKAAVYLRAEVYKKLKSASEALPQGMYFKIYCAYRSKAEQQELWQQNYERIKNENPFLSEKAIEQKTKAVCADPRYGFGGHQTGGAVDISLCDMNGTDLDMGTAYLEDNTNTVTGAKNLTQIQQQNRRLLKNSLTAQGFVNYPQEWWHYCYGDRMWAAYSHKKRCIYGLAEVPEER